MCIQNSASRHPQALASVQQSQYCDTLHHTRSRVAQKLAPRLERTVYSDVVFGRHEKVARLGRVVRCLLSDVVSFGAIGIIPVASVYLAQYRIERLLYASALTSVAACGRVQRSGMHTEV